MNSTSPGIPIDLPEPDIIVTVAGYENLELRRLVRTAIPMLKNPEAFPLSALQHCAQLLESVLEITSTSFEIESTDQCQRRKDHQAPNESSEV